MLNRMSLDGYFATTNKTTWGMDWFVHDPKVDEYAHKMGDNPAVDTLILGGITYRGFEKAWKPFLNNPDAPEFMRKTAEELTQLKKIVFSKTLQQDDITWDNTEVHAENPAEVIKKIKQEKGGSLLIMGSGQIIQQLANEGLIDEYDFIMSPVVSGGGKFLFKDVKQFKLNFLGAKSFDSGNVILRYEAVK